MKILLADTHPEVRSALLLALRRLPGANEIEATSSLIQLLDRCAQACPDLVLFDLDLGMPLADLMQALRRLCPRTILIGLSSRMDAKAEALQAGTDAFISKTDAPDEVTAIILRSIQSH